MLVKLETTFPKNRSEHKKYLSPSWKEMVNTPGERWIGAGHWVLIEPCKAEQTSPNQIFRHVVAVAPRPGVLRSRARHRENGPQHDDPWSREVTKPPSKVWVSTVESKIYSLKVLFFYCCVCKQAIGVVEFNMSSDKLLWSCRNANKDRSCCSKCICECLVSFCIDSKM